MSMVDPTAARLEHLRTQVESGKTQLTKAEARMEELTRQHAQQLEELKALGVTPETLDSEIARLAAERDQLMAEAERLLQGA